jgi:hypothetical protein
LDSRASLHAGGRPFTGALWETILFPIVTRSCPGRRRRVNRFAVP